VPGADNKQKLGELPTDTLKIQDLQAGSLDFIEKKGKPTLRDKHLGPFLETFGKMRINQSDVFLGTLMAR
jgi:hypothetical protein